MDLSIVVVAYDMQREAPRTIQSMLPPAQKAVEDISYEIVVVDNGSPEPLLLQDYSASGVAVKSVRVSPKLAQPSPVTSINQAVAEETLGEHLLICIDGARMFSPYLVRRTVDILQKNPSAFTYVGNRHLGSKKQSVSVKSGYNQIIEDSLLTNLGWQTDLDRLWEVSVWAGAHKPQNFTDQNESNALGFTRELWNQVGGYHPGFQRPGGGLCNLELFKRMVLRENGLNVLLLGEATFHQFHGGAATSNSGYFGSSLAEYRSATGAEYQRPEYAFVTDEGTNFQRLQTINQYLCN